MITPHPYQKEPVRKAIDYFREESPEPALMVLPTAWGKSILATEVAAEEDHLCEPDTEIQSATPV